MPTTSLYTLHGIDLAGTSITQLTDGGVTLNEQEMVEFSAGHPSPLFTSIRGQDPEIRFSTTQVGDFLSVVGQFGANLSTGNVDLYFRKVNQYGTRVATATAEHIRFRAPLAMAVWDSIQAGHQSNAVLTGRIVTQWDGSVIPISYAGSVATVGNPDAKDYYTLGPAKLNNAFIPGLQQVTINSGLREFRSGSAGELYNSFIAVEAAAPTINLSGEEHPAVWAFTETGTEVAAGTIIYLRGKLQTSGNATDITPAHIAVQVNAGSIRPQSMSGNSPNGAAVSGYAITGRAPDHLNDPLTINTGVAIA